MKTNNRERIKEINEQKLQARLNVFTTSKELGRNPLDDIIEGPMDPINTDTQQLGANSTTSTDMVIKQKAAIEGNAKNTKFDANQIAPTNQWADGNVVRNDETEVKSTENLSSLQHRFGVRKVKRPVKDAQLTARIESTTLKRFKDIVKAMYYPDKPNINETVTQIIRAFVDEYDKNSNNGHK